VEQLGGYQLGIDLGTTYTSAAVCRTDGRRWSEPEVVTLGSRSATVPSVLFIAEDGSVVVGDAAERRALTAPDRVVREFKRRIGDPTPLLVAGREWTPEELSARLVRWVVDRVAEREGGPAERTAVTHPASWGSHKRELFGAALAAQGLQVSFLAEPQAAALHYAAAERVEPGSTVAVYDLGGGTFDAAVVRKAEPGREAAAFGLLGRPEGLERLGGVDFDEVVFEHVREALPEVFGTLDAEDPAVLAAVSRVRRDCTEAKEALSADTEVSIPVLLPAAQGTVRLHRTEFESLVRPLVEETVTALRAAVASAGLTPDQLTAVLLVGGSSRIPLVAQTLSDQLGRPVAVDADPKNAIAMGAALAVSPRPTASWPGVAVAPVPVGAGVAAGGGATALRPAGLPPARPARILPAAATRGAPTDTAPTDTAPTRAVPTHGASRPVHEPATALLASRGPDDEPPRSTAAGPPGPVGEGPSPRRRLGLLVGAGSLVAIAVLVVGALLLSGAGAGSPFDTTGNSVVPSLPAPVGDTAPPAPVVAPVDPAVPAPAPAPTGAADPGADRGSPAAPAARDPRPRTPAPAAPATTVPPAPVPVPVPDPVVPDPVPPVLPDPDPEPEPDPVPPVDPAPVDPPPDDLPPVSSGGDGSTPPPSAVASDPPAPEVPPTTPDAV
jgi:actin-like ATPase involved in cell morphogenesis